jgi:hypothetical protein
MGLLDAGRRVFVRKQYLHLSVYPCEECASPVVAGSLTVRENEISRETDIRAVGEICLSCGHRQHHAGNTNSTRHFPPVEWQPVKVPKPGEVTPEVEPNLVPRD